MSNYSVINNRERNNYLFDIKLQKSPQNLEIFVGIFVGLNTN